MSFFAVVENQTDIALNLILNGLNINALHFNAYDIIIRKNNIFMLEFLLSHGANANTRDREDGITLLHIASECNNVEAANILISHGANINDNKNDRKYTPLMVACIFDSKEIAKLLISNGANVNMQDYIGRSPLHAAVLCNDTKAEDAEEKNSKFNRDNKDLIELLLSNGADVNAKTVEGYPPLHMASYASKPVSYTHLTLPTN